MLDQLDDGNFTFFWALEFVKELANNGLEHVVLSPGSRSTPLTMAFSLHPEIKKHVVLDERTAGYIVLGIGKSSGKPAALVCTSGTAAANYYPAVIEARMSGTPLLILTADRPPYLRAIGASQAIDQIKLFGDYPIMFFDAGEPVKRKTDLNRLKLLACQVFQDSIAMTGPVHVNFPFRKPLEPTPEFYKEQLEELKNSEKSLPKTTVIKLKDTRGSLPSDIIDVLKKAVNPVIIAGPASAVFLNDTIHDFCNTLKAPVLAESTSQIANSAFAISGFDAFLRDQANRTELTPDLIIRFGHQPVSKAIELYLKQHEAVPTIAFTEDTKWHDATNSVNYFVRRYSNITLPAEFTSSAAEDWVSLWRNKESKIQEAINTVLSNSYALTDGKVVRSLTPLTPKDWNIFLSNSFPVRDFDLFGIKSKNRRDIFVNRGASGIEGITSTSIGVALGNHKNTVLFIGDLAFLHDSNALLSSSLMKEQAMIIVILNNRGGNIFRMLPVHEHSGIYQTFFETPQQVSIEQLAKAHPVSYEKVDTSSAVSLPKIFQKRITQNGIHIIECMTDPEISMNERKEIWNY